MTDHNSFIAQYVANSELIKHTTDNAGYAALSSHRCSTPLQITSSWVGESRRMRGAAASADYQLELFEHVSCMGLYNAACGLITQRPLFFAHPRQFAALFISADWVCLLVQAGGGGWAGTAQTPEAANQGAKLMSAGVMLQRE